MKLSVTITGSYDAEPSHYGGSVTSAEMAAIDQANVNSGAVAPIDVIDWLDPDTVAITIQPKEETIPESDKITMRPVWARHQRRHYLNATMDPPTEEEMRDAILVLSDPDLQTEAPDLYLEAEIIHQDATDAAVTVEEHKSEEELVERWPTSGLVEYVEKSKRRRSV